MFGRATIRFGIGPHSSLLSFKFKSWRNAICDCSKIYYITLIVSTPHFVNLNNNTFRLKTFLFFVHLRWQPKRTEKVISNYQIYSVTILTLLLHFAWVVDDAKCIMVTRVCVCLSAAVRPHYCTDRDVTWGSGRGCPLVAVSYTHLTLPTIYSV